MNLNGGGERNLRQQLLMQPVQVTCGPLLMPGPGKVTSISPGIIRRNHSTAPLGVQVWYGWWVWVTHTPHQVPGTQGARCSGQGWSASFQLCDLGVWISLSGLNVIQGSPYDGDRCY